MACTVSSAAPRQAVASVAVAARPARWASAKVACPQCLHQRNLPWSSPSLRASRLWGQSVGFVQTRAAVSARSARPVQANWNPQVEWKEAAIEKVEKAAQQLFTLVVDVSKVPGLAEGYTNPGQYVQLKVGDAKPAFMAIASPPKAAQKRGHLEFLIKDIEGTTAGVLCSMSKGERVDISAVMGKGFNTEPISPPSEYPSVFIFATGTGISPIRSLLESGIEAGLRSDVRLYYGARSKDMMAYQERFKEWEAAGVKIIPVFSQPENGWTGHRGYVQAAFKNEKVHYDPARTGAILCGQKGMAEELTSLLEDTGVSRGRILMNF